MLKALRDRTKPDTLVCSSTTRTKRRMTQYQLNQHPDQPEVHVAHDSDPYANTIFVSGYPLVGNPVIKTVQESSDEGDG